MRRPHYALFLALQVFKVLGVQQDVNEGDKSTAARPNILIMLADDLGWHDLSWHNPRVMILLIIIDTMLMIIEITTMMTMRVFGINEDLKGDQPPLSRPRRQWNNPGAALQVCVCYLLISHKYFIHHSNTCTLIM